MTRVTLGAVGSCRQHSPLYGGVVLVNEVLGQEQHLLLGPGVLCLADVGAGGHHGAHADLLGARCGLRGQEGTGMSWSHFGHLSWAGAASDHLHRGWWCMTNTHGHSQLAGDTDGTGYVQTPLDPDNWRDGIHPPSLARSQMLSLIYPRWISLSLIAYCVKIQTLLETRLNSSTSAFPGKSILETLPPAP